MTMDGWAIVTNVLLHTGHGIVHPQFVGWGGTNKHKNQKLYNTHKTQNNTIKNNQSTKAVRRKNEELDTKKSLSLL